MPNGMFQDPMGSLLEFGPGYPLAKFRQTLY